MKTKFMELLELIITEPVGADKDLWLHNKIELNHDNGYLNEKQYDALLTAVANR